MNLIVKKAYKKSVLEFRKQPSSEKLAKLFTRLDRAAKTNVIHANKASRLKSRLSKLVMPAKKAAV